MRAGAFAARQLVGGPPRLVRSRPMRLSSLLDENAILLGLPGSDKRQLLERLVDLLPCSREPAMRDLILERLMAREAEEATGAGHGVALPHATAPLGPRVYCSLGITRDPVAFRAPDSRPVHCVFLTVGGEEHFQAVVMAFSVAVRMLREYSLRQALRESATPREAMEHIRRMDQEETR